MNEYLDRLVTCRNLLGEEQRVRVGDLTFRPSVYGIAIQDGKVLLVPCWDGYDFPGGGVHEGEPILESLIREVKEESGVDVTPDVLIHAQDDFFIHPRNHKAFHSILLYYTVTPTGGALSGEGLTEFEKSVAGGRSPEWVDIARVAELKFYNPVDSVGLITKAARLK